MHEGSLGNAGVALAIVTLVRGLTGARQRQVLGSQLRTGLIEYKRRNNVGRNDVKSENKCLFGRRGVGRRMAR
jgi:hypothetical protein